MVQFLMFFIFPIVILWQFGFRQTVANLLKAGYVILVLLVSSLLGLLLEVMFYPDNVRTYEGITLYTILYKNSIENLGQAFLIPYIFVIDILRLVIHYTFTHSKWIMNIVQLYGVYVCLSFLNLIEK
jgi:hypothetical protein